MLQRTESRLPTHQFFFFFFFFEKSQNDLPRGKLYLLQFQPVLYIFNTPRLHIYPRKWYNIPQKVSLIGNETVFFEIDIQIIFS